MTPTVASFGAAAVLLAGGASAGTTAGLEGRGGFCCWAADDLLDFCGTCLPLAVAGPSSYCSKSQAACTSCGAATWCEDAAKKNKEVSAGTELLLSYDADEAPKEGSTLRIELGKERFNATVVEADFEAAPTEPPTPAPEEVVEPTPAPEPETTVSEGPVEPNVHAVKQHGHLTVKGNKIIGEHGHPVRLRGMSLFWSQWMGKYWNPDAIRWLIKDWHVTLIRAAMAVSKGGYVENPDAELSKLEAVVDTCIEEGIYVVIDWHDYHADDRLEEAKAFFEKVAKKYGDKPNVLFETFNEPQQISWEDQIEPYHEQAVEVIRRYSNNIIILGTRTWSQEVDVASNDPVPGKNLAYTIHFYAASMGQDLRDKVSAALNNGVAIFATEWGTCEYTGDGRVDIESSQAWLDFLEENHISDANWAISDKAEACSALREGASDSGMWSQDDLTESGAFVRQSIREYNSAKDLTDSEGVFTEVLMKNSVRGFLHHNSKSRSAAWAMAQAAPMLACLAALAAATAVAARWLRARASRPVSPLLGRPGQTLRRRMWEDTPSSPCSPESPALDDRSPQPTEDLVRVR